MPQTLGKSLRLLGLSLPRFPSHPKIVRCDAGLDSGSQTPSSFLMTLMTVRNNNRPSARMIGLKFQTQDRSLNSRIMWDNQMRSLLHEYGVVAALHYSHSTMSACATEAFR